MASIKQSVCPQPSALYWSLDGTTIVCIGQDLYKINEPLLETKLNTLSTSEVGGYQCLKFPDSWEIRSNDFELLLEHLKHKKYAYFASYTKRRPECDQTSRVVR